MGHLRVGAAVRRPYRDAVRVPRVRTGGSFAKRLGRMVLWLLVVVLLLRGLASVATPREVPPPAPVPKAASPAWPDDAARAFAADFARAYLSYDPSDPAASISAVQPFVASGFAGSMAPQFGEKAPRQAVSSVTVARTASLDSSHALARSTHESWRRWTTLAPTA